MQIPDLRHNSEITLEHCSVLLEKLGQALNEMEGQSGFSQITDKINPRRLLEHFELHFEPETFTRMFLTELGKGVLVGTYMQVLLDKQLQEEAEELY